MIAPFTPGSQWFKHIYREYNREADRIADMAVELGHSVSGINVNIDGGVSGTNYGGLTALDGGAS